MSYSQYFYSAYFLPYDLRKADAEVKRTYLYRCFDQLHGLYEIQRKSIAHDKFYTDSSYQLLKSRINALSEIINAVSREVYPRKEQYEISFEDVRSIEFKNPTTIVVKR